MFIAQRIKHLHTFQEYIHTDEARRRQIAGVWSFTTL